jgi:hypothetical protein
MDGAGNPDLGALLRDAARSRRERSRVLGLLSAACWPGGGDRYEPAARAWVRAWGPAPAAAPLPACDCASGRCGVCN